VSGNRVSRVSHSGTSELQESVMKHLSESAKRVGFNIHAIVFVPTIVLLVILNLIIGRPYWVQWVLLGWGIGLLMHWWFGRGSGASARVGTD
jgi:hypothetical protein